MTRSPCCEIALEFGGAERTFSLPLGAIRKLEGKRDVGIFRMRQRLFDVAAQADFRQRVLDVAMSGAGSVAEMRQRIVELVLSSAPVVPTADSLVEADLFEILTCGLEGGGMKPSEAAELMRSDYYPARPLQEFVLPALAVVNAAIAGAPGHQYPKSNPEAATAEAAPPDPATAASTSPPSTAGAPSSASAPPPSTGFPSGNSTASSPAG